MPAVINFLVGMLILFFWAASLQVYLNYRRNESENQTSLPTPMTPMWSDPQFKTQRDVYAYLVAGGAVTHWRDTRIRIEFKNGKLTGYATFADPTNWRKV